MQSQSQRKKLGEFNTPGVSAFKNTLFKSERKISEPQEMYSQPYHPSIEQYPELQNIVRHHPSQIRFESVFFMSKKNEYEKKRPSQQLTFANEQQKRFQFVPSEQIDPVRVSPYSETFTTEWQPIVLVNQQEKEDNEGENNKVY